MIHMTKRDLIDALARFPDDAPVFVVGSNSTPFRHILHAPGPAMVDVRQWECNGGSVGVYDTVQITNDLDPEHKISSGAPFRAIVLYANPFHGIRRTIEAEDVEELREIQKALDEGRHSPLPEEM